MLKIGAYLTLVYQESAKKSVTFRCRIVEVDDQNIFIDYPINEKTNKTQLFHKGTIFNAIYQHEKQVFKFTTQLIDRKTGNIPMLILNYPEDSELTRIQRRNFVRIETSVDTAVHSAESLFSPFITITGDIGGGGALINLPVNHPLTAGDVLTVWFVLPMQSEKYHYLTCQCEVVRIFIDKTTNNEKASLKFIKLKENAREAIIRYCFEQELLTRKLKR